MGIIRAIRSNELVGGDSDDPIYPVTSVKAIYDLDNRALDAIIEELKASIDNTSTKASVLEVTLREVSSDMDSIKEVLRDLQGNIDTILSNVLDLEAAVAEKNNQNNYIVAKVTVDSTMSRSTPENVDNNIECYWPIKEHKCYSSTAATDYILNIKDGEILVPTKPGTYILDNKEIEVIDYSLIQKQGEDFVVISLGIPMPKEEDKESTLKVAEDGSLYWG